MYLVNSPTTSGLVNGARGTVLAMNYARNRRTVSSVTVKFDDIAEPQQVTKVQKMIMPLSDCMVHRSQFPLVLAYAVTIHKSQSLTLPCVFADLGDAIFAAGQCNVALSRCKTLEGLYLFNFNPSKVYCSNRAVRQQARLLEMEESELPHNNPKSWRNVERVWYTRAYERMAKRAMKTDLKNEDEAKKSTTAKDSKKAETTQRKRKKACKSGSVPEKATDVNVIDVDALHEQEADGTVVVILHFQYHPVDARWQRKICSAFGWSYEQPSAPSICSDPVEINQFQVPLVKSIGGDGNCFYRTISYIVTGKENRFDKVKESIFRFMRRNVEVMKEIERMNPSYHYFSDNDMLAIDRSCTTDRKFQEKYDADARVYLFLDHFERDRVWANCTIMTYTAIMLKTNYMTFSKGSQREGERDVWYVNQHRYEMRNQIWTRWKPFISYPEGADLTPTLEQEMYLQWKNGDHFEAACLGIEGIHT